MRSRVSTLPASIESTLEEAGFSPTEIVILKRLLEENGVTLRHIAARTGKSTGVLDQAMKKLLKKGIVTREEVNGTPQYTLTSLNAVLRWLQEDVERKHEQLVRRHQNFESFISSLQVDRSRPDMQFFEETGGLEQAYRKLLDLGKEMLQYVPVFTTAEDDPMRDFRVQYFRERRRRGIFARVIAHDTPLGRRYQSRDPFEYRKSLLLPEADCPFTFEKIVIGDTVACFNTVEKRACFIHYPELAAAERAMFEAIWKKGSVPAAGKAPAPQPEEQVTKVPLSTRTLSSLREFFLSPKSIVTFVALAIIAAGVTYGLYWYTHHLTLQRVRDRVMSIAATGALQFDPADLDQLRTVADIRKPAYAKVIVQLNEIRNQNPGVKYAYVLRTVNVKEQLYEFVADADSLDPFAKKDLNGDGLINDMDHLTPPGELYEDQLPVENQLDEPTSTPAPVTDQWGTFISGWAPIKDDEGNTVAVFGVDKFAEDVARISLESFKPLYWFVGLFVLFVLMRLFAFNRSLSRELIDTFRLKQVALAVLAFTVIAGGTTYSIYHFTSVLSLRRIQEQVKSIAATGALQFDAKDLEQLRTEDDVRKPIYTKIVLKLNEIRAQNEGVPFVYIMRPTKDPDMYEFVADADALNPFDERDVNGDGQIDEKDHLPIPGEKYPITDSDPPVSMALEEPTSFEPSEDQWGVLVSGWAPIRDREGKTVAVLGADKLAKDVSMLTRQMFNPLLFFASLCVLSFLVFLIAFNWQIFGYFWKR